MLLVVALFVLAVSTQTLTEDPLYRDYLQWSAKYGKVYATGVVDNTRFSNWKKSLEIIRENNEEVLRTGVGAMFALNRFSDLSPQEFKQRHLLKSFTPVAENLREYVPIPKTALLSAPLAWDWTLKGKTTKGQCGSCWAFSAVENIESVWMIGKNLDNATMAPLSPQQIVDCDGVDGGCDGGDTPTAYQYVIKAGGVQTNKDYPYRAIDDKCRFDKTKVYTKIAGFKFVTKQGDEKTLIESIASVAPPSICVDASRWQYYDSGVMTAAQCSKNVELDHCVQITGYDLSSKTPYYQVRNSWGEGWGESGHIRLAYGTNTCGVTDEATTATL